MTTPMDIMKARVLELEECMLRCVEVLEEEITPGFESHSVWPDDIGKLKDMLFMHEAHMIRVRDQLEQIGQDWHGENELDCNVDWRREFKLLCVCENR